MIDHGTDNGAFLGPLGGLIEFVHYKGSFKVDDDREVKFTKTIGGGRFGFQEPTSALRSWSVSTHGLDSTQWAAFDLLRSGTYGNQHRFITPLAQVTNVISPLRSLPGLDGNLNGTAGDALAGGLLTTPDGARVPSVVSGGGSVYLRFDTPVLPGEVFTVSVYMSSAGTAILNFVDAGGNYVSGAGGLTKPGTGSVVRAFKTETAPPGAAAAYLTITGASVIAAPALSWTKTLMPWARGRGCERAVIHGISESEEDADPRYPQSDFNFTVTEVGVGA